MSIGNYGNWNSENKLEGDEVETTSNPEESPEYEYEDQEDGSVLVIPPSEEPGAENGEPTDFYANIVESIPSGTRSLIASRLLELIGKDKEARKKRDEKYAEGIKRTGLGDEAPGGAEFDGASRVVHPILAESCVDFAANAIKETFPPSGPVRTKIEGKVTAEKLKKAENKRDFLNWQLTKQIGEYRRVLEVNYTQLPLAGNGYIKWFFDPHHKRPRAEFVPIDNLFIPFYVDDFYSSPRISLRKDIDSVEFDNFVKAGIYIDIDNMRESDSVEEVSAAQQATDKIEGVERSNYNEDGLRTVYESIAIYSIDEDPKTEGDPCPYIFHIDESTGNLLGVFRNWDEEDPRRVSLNWYVEYGFIPWRGALAVGLPHLIGSMAGAMTGALRALLDSAHINNMPGLLRLKSRMGGQNLTLNPAGVTEIEGGGNDDIRKVMMAIPYNPTSPVLLELLGFLDKVSRGVVSTASEKIADVGANTPVGTTLALIEQGSKVYSAIHARLHAAQEKTLEILCRLNASYLDDKMVVKELGGLEISREDFQNTNDIIPVTDPNIFSETQRFAQMQAVDALAQKHPTQFRERAIVKRQLEQLKIPQYEELLVPEMEMKQANPVAENISMSLGRPAQVFPDQDHEAHINVHLKFLKDPLLGASQFLAPTFTPLCLKHIQEHLVFWYGKWVHEATSKVLGKDLSEYTNDPTVQNRLDQLMAVATNSVHPLLDEEFKALPQLMQESLQLLQSLQTSQTPPPPNPTMLEIERKTRKDQAELATKQAELGIKQQQLAADQQLKQADIQMKQAEIQKDYALSIQDLASREKMNMEDNTTALRIAAGEILTGEKVGVSTGTGINPSP